MLAAYYTTKFANCCDLFVKKYRIFLWLRLKEAKYGFYPTPALVQNHNSLIFNLSLIALKLQNSCKNSDKSKSNLIKNENKIYLKSMHRNKQR